MLGGDEGGVDVVHRLVGPALEGPVEGCHGEEAGVVACQLAQVAEDDAVGPALGQLHGQPAQSGGKRNEWAEHVQVLGPDGGDVDGVRDHLPLQRRHHLLGHDHPCPVLGLAGGGGEMGRDDDIVQLQEGAGVGLVGEHVQGRRRHLARAQGRHQRLLVYQAAPSGVDDARPIFHSRQRLGAHEAAGVVGEGQMEGEEVAACQHLVQGLRSLHPQLPKPLSGDEGVVGEDAHAQAQRPPGDLLADAAQPEDAQDLVAQLDAGVPLPLPPPRLEGGVGLGDVAGEGEEEPDGVLGGGDDGGLGGVGDDDTPPGGGSQVDVVHPHPGSADDLEPVRPLDQIGADPGGGEEIAAGKGESG